MKHAKEVGAYRVAFRARNFERISSICQHLSGVRIAALLIIMAVVTGRSLHASDAAPAAQWNIMVVPSRQTAFSGGAKEMFNKNCAPCHSKDGRAQTPVARQRHVQDLSECKLEDDKIIEQILEGTHNKTNTFKMPPFKEKLTRAEVESLVPLVRAFRPLPLPLPNKRSDDDQSVGPRLVGIINLDWCGYAVLESGRSPGRYFMLREKESHEGVSLIKIRPKKGAVKLNVGGTNPIVTLTLDGWAASHPKAKGISGFLARLGDALADTPQGIALNGANTDLVLFLYSQFSGQTLIRSPRLPAALFDLDFLAPSPETAAHRLNKALAVKGITTIEDGEKFLLVVPTSEVAAVKPRFSEIRSLARDNSRPGLFPGGVFINLPNTELSRMVKLYADLTGRRLDRTRQLPSSNDPVNFTTQTALSQEECAYALETLLSWHGLKVVPVGSDEIKVDLVRTRQ
ncbi:MAG: c-type cytochrome [Verrucomicrobia bacterium]|nr:c-type cytochrome [Verrucomicrobiota bacterium]